jgi:N-formylglutamate amidohydrolase
VSETFSFLEGSTPLLISIPHCGTKIPDHLAARMTPAALVLADTDWHLHRLYDFAPALGAHILMADFSRYVVDLNRDPEGRELYPGRDNTPIVPLDTFDRLPLYRPGQEPDAAEVERRIETYWKPYHARLASELAHLKERYGRAVLFDAHSIRSRLPRFFKGRLADFNLGTASGRSLNADLARSLLAICEQTTDATSVLDDRFTGGHITRHYGRPAEGIEAVQLEITWALYMDENAPYRFRPERADALRPTLKRLIETLIASVTERVR